MLKRFIRLLKTSPLLLPLLASIDLVLWLVDRVAVLSVRTPEKPLSLVIIRLDVMGDYLMFRNYLRALKKSARYENHSITLFGNVAVKSLAETFDSGLIDRFVWVDIYKLSTQPLYRFKVVRQLRLQGFSVAFCPAYSRVLVLDDFMALATGASERVGCRTDYVNIAPWEAALGDRLYTRLIDSGSGIVFEMERDRRIVEGFVQEPVAVQPPLLDGHHARDVSVPDRYVVFSLGAGQEFRVWPVDRFAEVARFILVQYPAYKLVLTGAPNEKPYTESFLKHLPDASAIVDLTGSLSIPELVYVLTNADLLIANETGIAHIAASTQTPSIVISQGKSLVRWHPYPTAFGEMMTYVYPDYLEQRRANLPAIASGFNPESPLSINEITVQRVMHSVNERLRRVDGLSKKYL
ncbi:glycosyltransferase family 9 protein [Spirosoma sp.]|uniref:glycosyltransferase family 9 protein n=1 Tax=Spirosoma sp. TaxID=1899569 RepID=UPI0026059B0A|nr:glycosyltransferase family 9 protein [Spirosoma sp.]MCX6213638.1 lipopolysaccharide heptosyltransferase family protein [Spirosoma sp.]